MAKTCNCGCGWPVFSHGYAKYCQSKRTDDKKPKKIPAHTKRERIKEFDWGFDNQVELFLWCWENAQNEKGEVFCKYTGEKLNVFSNSDMWYSCFAHVLSKGRYPWFKLNPANIEVVLPLFHQFVDQSTCRQRESRPTWKFNLWYEKVEQMKAEYLKFKKENLLA